MTNNPNPFAVQLAVPTIFFDIESTGTDVAHDRIIDLYAKKISPDNQVEVLSIRLNPQREIAAGATAVHGITHDMVKDCPTFKDMKVEIYDFFKGCSFAGYNIINFDIPMLNEEFLRCDIYLPFRESLIIDIYNIFRKKEGRSLSDAVRFYCGREMVDAHNASADVDASIDIFAAQVLKYAGDLGSTQKDIADFSKMNEILDYSGWFTKDDNGKFIYAKGKSKGTRVYNDPGFAQWLTKQAWPTRDSRNWADDILQSIYSGEDV